ncbi:MAG: DUF6290 family protein [Streptosporangiaceae bacterium]
MVSVRLSASEADAIRAAADEAGQSVSGFIRRIVLDRIRSNTPSVPVLAFAQGTFSRVVTHIDLMPGTPVSGGVPSSAGDA